LEKTAGTEFALGDLQLSLEGELILPLGEINRMRRDLLGKLTVAAAPSRPELPGTWRETFRGSEPHQRTAPASAPEKKSVLRLLCRSIEQIDAALELGWRSRK
jgi:putative protease